VVDVGPLIQRVNQQEQEVSRGLENQAWQGPSEFQQST
jgi:hypothetical protein